MIQIHNQTLLKQSSINYLQLIQNSINIILVRIQYLYPLTKFITLILS